MSEQKYGEIITAEQIAEAVGTLAEIARRVELLKAREAKTAEFLREHIEAMERRIATAVEAAQQANRFSLLTRRNGRPSAQVCSDGDYAWASVLDDIVSILHGNTPKKLEGSP